MLESWKSNKDGQRAYLRFLHWADWKVKMQKGDLQKGLLWLFKRDRSLSCASLTVLLYSFTFLHQTWMVQFFRLFRASPFRWPSTSTSSTSPAGWRSSPSSTTSLRYQFHHPWIPYHDDDQHHPGDPDGCHGEVLPPQLPLQVCSRHHPGRCHHHRGILIIAEVFLSIFIEE